MTTVQICKEVRQVAFSAAGPVVVADFVAAMEKISAEHGQAAQTVCEHYGISVGDDTGKRVVFPWA